MDAAEYKLTFDDRGDYLFVQISGRDSFASSLRYWNEIADEIEKRGHRKLFVHENLTDGISARETYDLIMDLKQSVLKDVKIALVDENSANTFVNNLGKLIANRSGAKVRIFSRPDKARRWIERVT